LELKILINFR